MGTARQARESRGRERGVVLMLSFFVIIILIAVVGLMFVESQVDSGISHSRERSLQLEAAEAGAIQYAQALLLADPVRRLDTATVGSEVELGTITSSGRARSSSQSETHSMLPHSLRARNRAKTADCWRTTRPKNVSSIGAASPRDSPNCLKLFGAET